MSFLNSKPSRNVGVGSQYNCFHDTPNTDGSLKFETEVTRLKTVLGIETNEERSAEPVYASNEEYDVDVTSEPPTLAVDHTAFPPAILARMRGNKVENAFVIHSTYDNGEYFAHGVVYPLTNGHKKFVWYPKCKLVSSSDSAKTKDKNGTNNQDKKMEIQTFTFNGAGEYKIEYNTELVAQGGTPVTEEEFFATPLLAPITD